MPDRPVVLDSNLLVLLVVGLASPDYILTHKRLSAYTRNDFALLVQLLSGTSRLMVTPNTLTETMNLAGQATEPARMDILQAFRRLLGTAEEDYIESRRAADRTEFLRLGLTDLVVLESAADNFTIITADLNLYLEAMRLGQSLMYPLILPLGRCWNERIAGGYGVPEKNPGCSNRAMILLFHPTASLSTAL